MRAKLSSTLAGMALLECTFPLLVLGPLLRQRLASGRALENTAPALNERRGHGLQENSLRRGLDHGFCPVLDVELFAQAKWDDHLALCREPYGFEFFSWTHVSNSYICDNVRQHHISRIAIFRGDSRLPTRNWSRN